MAPCVAPSGTPAVLREVSQLECVLAGNVAQVRAIGGLGGCEPHVSINSCAEPLQNLNGAAHDERAENASKLMPGQISTKSAIPIANPLIRTLNCRRECYSDPIDVIPLDQSQAATKLEDKASAACASDRF